MNVLAFNIPGEPVPKGRARTARTKRGDIVTYTPAKTRAYEGVIRIIAQSAVSGRRWSWGDRTRFRVEVAVHRKHQEAGGDADNYLKAALDGMNGVVFPDDRYVRELKIVIHDASNNPHLEIIVSKWEAP